MVNRVILVGYVGREPEVRSLETGVKIARLSVATTERFTNGSGERVESTQWHDIVLWRAQADFAERYIHTGSQVYLEGKLRYRQMEDAAGRKFMACEVHCDLVRQLIKPLPSGDVSSGLSQEKIIIEVDSSDDLPF